MFWVTPQMNPIRAQTQTFRHFCTPPDCEDEPVVDLSYQSTSNSDLPSVLL